MTTVETSIRVNVPVQTVYDQWTQFEEFPKFMTGVKEVTRLDDTRSHWKAQIVGKAREWDAEIVERVPEQRIAWKSRRGAINEGVVTFRGLSEARSLILVQLRYMPEGVLENLGGRWGAVSAQVDRDLERFKTFIEERHCDWSGSHQNLR
jgi:uncharacterized membrane protein